MKIHKITPAIISIMLLILSSVNWYSIMISDLMPYVIYICVFYWAVFSPYLLPRWFVVVLGLIADVLYSLPLGMTAIILLLMWSFIVSQRQYIIAQPFWALWLIFSIMLFFFIMVKWFFLTFVIGYQAYLDNVIMKFLSTILFYPLFAMVFAVLPSEES